MFYCLRTDDLILKKDKNMEKKLVDAFPDSGNNTKKYKEVLFFCNINQKFI